MAHTKAELENKIAGAEKQLANPSMEKFHAKFRDSIQKYKADLAELEKAEKEKVVAEKEVVKEEKKIKEVEHKVAKTEKQTAEEKKVAKAASQKKYKAAKAAEKKTHGKKSAAKKPHAEKPKHEEKHESGKKYTINRKDKTVTLNGKVYDIEGCEVATEIWHSIKVQRKEGTKKFSKKKAGTVLGDKIGSAIEGVVKNISPAQLKDKGSIRKKLQEMSKMAMELASLMDTILKDKSASQEVRDAVKVIEKFIAEKLNSKK